MSNSADLPSTGQSTADDPTTSLPTASLLRRFASIVYDAFLVVAISMLYGAMVLAIQVALFGPGDKDFQPTVEGPLFQLGWYLSIAGFYYYFWRKSGQTVGMRAWRMKLVNKEGKVPSPLQCAIRILLAPLSLFLLGLGYLWCLIDRQGDAAHDRLSGTRVIVTPKPQKTKQA